MQFVDHRHLAEGDLLQQQLDIADVVGVAPRRGDLGPGGVHARLEIRPKVDEVADHLGVDEGDVGARGLVDLILVGRHHDLAGPRTVQGRRVGVEGPVEADDGAVLVLGDYRGSAGLLL